MIKFWEFLSLYLPPSGCRCVVLVSIQKAPKTQIKTTNSIKANDVRIGNESHTYWSAPKTRICDKYTIPSKMWLLRNNSVSLCLRFFFSLVCSPNICTPNEWVSVCVCVCVCINYNFFFHWLDWITIWNWFRYSLIQHLNWTIFAYQLFHCFILLSLVHRTTSIGKVTNFKLY